MCSDRMSVEECRERLLDFGFQRNWQSLRYPRNYILALVGEFGELVELFEGLDEENLSSTNTSNPDLFQLLCEELSDCILYSLALTACAGVNLSRIAINPSADIGIDFDTEFPIRFDDGIYFDELVDKISPEIQKMSPFTLVLRMARKL